MTGQSPHPYPPDPRTQAYRQTTDRIRWEPLFVDPNAGMPQPPPPNRGGRAASGGSWRWLAVLLLLALCIGVAAVFRRPIYGLLCSISRISGGSEKDLLVGLSAYGLLLVWTLALVRILASSRTR